MTYPVKFVTVAVFAAPLLAAFGLARLQTLEAGQRREFQKRLVFLAGLLLALIAGILLWAWRFPLQGDDVPATLRNGAGRAGFLAVVALLLFALRSDLGGRASPRAQTSPEKREVRARGDARPPCGPSSRCYCWWCFGWMYGLTSRRRTRRCRPGFMRRDW